MCKCFFCKENIEKPALKEPVYIYSCPNCGIYILSEGFRMNMNNIYGNNIVDYFKTYCYLVHHRKEDSAIFLGDRDAFDSYKKINKESTAIMVTNEEIINWYPKTFKEKIDKILLYLSRISNFEGDLINIDIATKYAIFFCDSEDLSSKKIQKNFIINYLEKSKLISHNIDKITLLPDAYSLIYDLEKFKTNNKNAFVAMKFGPETTGIREAIRKGISNSGYNAIFIDEKIHNHQIVPVMIDEIKKAKFLVMDCTYPNCGAYYEAGIAFGEEKEVIITCKNDVFNSKDHPHFDIFQKQTLVWEDEDDLSEKLTMWINAVIY